MMFYKLTNRANAGQQTLFTLYSKKFKILLQGYKQMSKTMQLRVCRVELYVEYLKFRLMIAMEKKTYLPSVAPLGHFGYGTLIATMKEYYYDHSG